MRISIWTWFAPSALFILVTSIGSRVVDRESLPTWALAGTIGGVLLAGAVAARGESTGWPGTRWAVPLLLLASATFVHGADHARIGSSLLLTAVPAGWMAFELGSRGAATAIAGMWAVAATPYVVGAQADRDTLQRWDDVVALTGLTAMVLLTWHAGRILGRAQAELVARSRSLEREVATTRAIFDSVDAALAVFLPDDHVLVNAPASRLGHGLQVLPVTSTQRATASAYDVADADGVTATVPAAQAVLRAQRGEEFSGLVQWTGPPHDRRAMVCSARRILLDGQSDGAVGTVLVAWDATDALDTARVRDEFLGTLTHELRTPLTAIVGYLDLHGELEVDEDGTAARTYLAGVRRNVQALADHIDDLLVRAQPGQLHTEVVDVAEVAQSAVAAVADRARAADLKLVLESPGSLQVVANEGAVRQVLDHLLDNALTYTETGEVTVEVERCGEHDSSGTGTSPATSGFTIAVTDTGIGMSEHELTRVFDRFYRTEAAVSRVLPGLGMGLAVTRQLVTAHGGTVTVQSTPGIGSRFEVTVPAPVDRS